jgi:ATP-dependent Lon protease
MLAQHAPLVCLVGPSGGGKSALVRGLARAAGWQYRRIGLDPAHTVGDICGQAGESSMLMQACEQAGTDRLIIELDGVDTITDAAAVALVRALESLPDHDAPEGHAAILWVASARVAEAIPALLAAHLDVVALERPTNEQKLAIGRGFLLPSLIEAHGLNSDELAITDMTMRGLVAACASEPGVHGLARLIAARCRLAALRIVARQSGHEPDSGPVVF